MKNNKKIIKDAQKAILRFTHDKDQFMSLVKEKPNFDILCELISKIQLRFISGDPHKSIKLDIHEMVLVGAVLSMFRDEIHTATIDADIQNIKSQTKDFD